MPGVGKTFLGNYASQRLGVDFVDLDKTIEETQQATISEIFRTRGEESFRDLELSTLKTIIKDIKSDTIMATGGGTPWFNNAMDVMKKSGMTVWMDSDIDHLIENMRSDLISRPLLDDKTEKDLRIFLMELYQSRAVFYAQSDLKVSVYRGLSPDLFTKQLHLSTFVK